MKNLLYIAVALFGVCFAASCSDDDDQYRNIWEEYAPWRAENLKWLGEQETKLDEDGSLFYSKLSPVWSPNSYILIHWFNDRSATAGNLTPLITSWVTATYDGYLYDGSRFDSSSKAEGGVFTSQLSGVIDGWQIAMMNMHVGDTVQIVVPYQQGYGYAIMDSIPPFSVLRFNMRLTDIPAYEVKP